MTQSNYVINEEEIFELIYNNDKINNNNIENIILIDNKVSNYQLLYDSLNEKTLGIIYDYNNTSEEFYIIINKFINPEFKRLSIIFSDTNLKNGKSF